MEVEKVFDNVISAANARNRPQEGDYEKDGILYCGKCNTPKQVEIELFGRVRKPYCLCVCAKAELDAEEEAQKRFEREQRIKELRRDAFPTSEMQNWTFEKDDKKNKRISEVAKRYAENFSQIRRMEDLNGLIFFGGVGTGKTYVSACIANALIDKGYSCKMTNFARLVNVIGGMYSGKQEYIDSLNDYDLLVIDDLAAERETDYMNEIVFNVIDARVNSKKPLIITTNLSGEQLKNPENERKRRIYSRILERCTPVEVSGEDRRKIKLKENYKGMSELLGLKGEET